MSEEEWVKRKMPHNIVRIIMERRKILDGLIENPEAYKYGATAKELIDHYTDFEEKAKIFYPIEEEDKEIREKWRALITPKSEGKDE